MLSWKFVQHLPLATWHACADAIPIWLFNNKYAQTLFRHGYSTKRMRRHYSDMSILQQAYADVIPTCVFYNTHEQMSFPHVNSTTHIRRHYSIYIPTCLYILQHTFADAIPTCQFYNTYAQTLPTCQFYNTHAQTLPTCQFYNTHAQTLFRHVYSTTRMRRRYPQRSAVDKEN